MLVGAMARGCPPTAALALVMLSSWLTQVPAVLIGAAAAAPPLLRREGDAVAPSTPVAPPAQTPPLKPAAHAASLAVEHAAVTTTQNSSNGSVQMMSAHASNVNETEENPWICSDTMQKMFREEPKQEKLFWDGKTAFDVTFFVKEGVGKGKLPAFLFAHPNRTMNESTANVVIISLQDDCPNPDQLRSLPRRPIQRPYFLYHPYLPERYPMKSWYSLFDERKDIMFGWYDTREHDKNDDDARPFPGITLPAPDHFYKGPSLDPAMQPRYFMTFRGYCKWRQHVRPDMFRAFRHFHAPQDVVVEFIDGTNAEYAKAGMDRFNALMDTAYAIVPHGDSRWSVRFPEVIGACAIPLVLANGLELPFSPLIDWTSAAVQLNETLAAEPEKLLASLSRDPAHVRRMRENVCALNSKYFATVDLRWKATLNAAIKYQETRSST